MEFDAKELKAIAVAEGKITRAIASLHAQLSGWVVESIELDSDSHAHINRFVPVPGAGQRLTPGGPR